MKADEMLPAWVADISHLLRRIGKQAAYTMKFAYMAMREKKIKISQLSNRVAAIWIISQLQTGYRFCGKSYLSPDYLGVWFLVKNQVSAAYRFRVCNISNFMKLLHISNLYMQRISFLHLVSNHGDPKIKYRGWMDAPLIFEECIWHCSRFDNQEYCTFIDIFLR